MDFVPLLADLVTRPRALKSSSDEFGTQATMIFALRAELKNRPFKVLVFVLVITIIYVAIIIRTLEL